MGFYLWHAHHFYIHNIKSIREIRLKSFFFIEIYKLFSYSSPGCPEGQFQFQRSTQTVVTDEKLDRIYSRE